VLGTETPGSVPGDCFVPYTTTYFRKGGAMNRSIRKRLVRIVEAKVRHSLPVADKGPPVEIGRVRRREKGGGSTGLIVPTSRMDMVIKSPENVLADFMFDPAAKIANALRIDQVCRSRSWGAESFGTVLESGQTLWEMPRISPGAKGHALIRYETDSVSLASLIAKERRRRHPSHALCTHIGVTGQYLAQQHGRELMWHNTNLSKVCADTHMRNQLYNRYILSQTGKISSEIYADVVPTYLSPEEWDLTESLVTGCLKRMRDNGSRVSGINGDFGPANIRFRNCYFTAAVELKTEHILVADTGSIQIGDPAHDVARMLSHLMCPFTVGKRPSFWRELMEAFLRGYLGRRADPGLMSFLPLPYWRMVLYLLNKGGGLVELKNEKVMRMFALHGVSVLKQGEFFIPTA